MSYTQPAFLNKEQIISGFHANNYINYIIIFKSCTDFVV